MNHEEMLGMFINMRKRNKEEIFFMIKNNCGQLGAINFVFYCFNVAP